MTRRTDTHIDAVEKFAQRLRAARDDAGLTQRELSFPGCTTGYVSRLEYGARVPSLQVIHELARRLGVSGEWLARGNDDGETGSLAEIARQAELALRLDDREHARDLYHSLLAAEHPTQFRARAEAGLGQLAFLEDDASAAIEHLERAYELDSELDDAAADTLGRAYARIGAEEEAQAVFRRALGRADDRDDRVNRIRFTVLLANCLIDATEFAEAAALLSRALAEIEGGDAFSVARVQWAQSRLHAYRGETELASKYAHQALALLEASEFTAYTARACRALAHIELDGGNAEEALRLIERGRSLLGAAGTSYDSAVFALEEARALAQLDRLEEAASLAMASTTGFADAHPVDVGRSYSQLGDALARRGDTERALGIYELAIEFHERRPSRFLAETYAHYAELLERSDRTPDAFAAYKRAATLHAELAHPKPR